METQKRCYLYCVNVMLYYIIVNLEFSIKLTMYVGYSWYIQIVFSKPVVNWYVHIRLVLTLVTEKRTSKINKKIKNFQFKGCSIWWLFTWMAWHCLRCGTLLLRLFYFSVDIDQNQDHHNQFRGRSSVRIWY